MRIKKRILTVFLCAALTVLSGLFASCVSAPGISAASAVVMVKDTGEILYEKDPYTHRSMASTTKIMTSYLALKQGTPDREITVTSPMLTEGTSLGLKAGDKITLRSLVCGMLLQSGNDAANAVAYTLAGSLPAFAERMNAEARRLGMEYTNFVTPSGLDAKDHYSCAYDMALLSRAAMDDPVFAEICAMKTAEIRFLCPEKNIVVSNHNRLLRELPGTVGIKTGFTKKSGRCLVSAVERDGNMLLIVTLNAPDDWHDHKVLAEYGFSVLKNKRLQSPVLPSLRVVGSEKTEIPLRVRNLPYYGEGADADIDYKIFLSRFVYAPVEKSDTVGEVRYYRDGKEIARIPIEADADAPRLINEKNQPWIVRFFGRLLRRERV